MWPTCEQSGYIIPIVTGFPISGSSSKRGHMWAKWLRNSFVLGGPHIGEEIKMWPTCKHNGYISCVIGE